MLYFVANHQGQEVGRRPVKEKFVLSMRKRGDSGSCLNCNGTFILPFDDHCEQLTVSLIGVINPENAEMARFHPMFNYNGLELHVHRRAYDKKHQMQLFDAKWDGKQKIRMRLSSEVGSTELHVSDWSFYLANGPDPNEIPLNITDTMIITPEQMEILRRESTQHTSRWQQLSRYLSTVHLPGFR